MSEENRKLSRPGKVKKNYTAPPSREDTIGQMNALRRHFGLPEIKKARRNCMRCGTEFTAYLGYRTCGSCRIEMEELECGTAL